MRTAQTTFPGEPHFHLAIAGLAGGTKGEYQGQSPWLRIGESRSKVLASSPAQFPSRSFPFPMPEESTQPANDQRLLAAVACGEAEAFAALYDRLSGPLYALCLRMTGEAQEAEDILQEVCVTIWKRAASYDSARSSVFSWAVHLTRCKAIDHLRSRGRRLRVVIPAGSNGEGDDHDNSANRFTSEAAADNGSTASETLDRNERAAHVRRVLSALPAEQSQVIQLAFFSDLSHHEISARLSQPLGTVKARIRRGLMKLRDGLKGGGS